MHAFLRNTQQIIAYVHTDLKVFVMYWKAFKELKTTHNFFLF